MGRPGGCALSDGVAVAADRNLSVPAQQTATVTILIEVSDAGSGAAGVVVYARVSSHDQRVGLDGQVARVVVGLGETTDDLVRDMTGVLASMCARLYGRRGARNWAMRAVTAARNADMDAAA